MAGSSPLSKQHHPPPHHHLPDALLDHSKVSKPRRDRAFVVRYKRPRGSIACTVCRARKVRCDAAVRMPCANCVTFDCECVLPNSKRKPLSSTATLLSEDSTPPSMPSKTPTPQDSSENMYIPRKFANDKIRALYCTISAVNLEPTGLKDKDINPPSTNRARQFGKTSIAYITEKIGQNHNCVNLDQYGLPTVELDMSEPEVLRMRGVFRFPDKDLCREMVKAFFEHTHPLLPVINQTQFMRKFDDPNDNPLLLLLQAVMLCGCRVSNNERLLDLSGLTNTACLIFLRRAQALYEARYETDSVAIVLSLILIASFWNGPDDVSQNSFYWTRVAIALAQGFGFQRDISSLDLLLQEKRTWRRVWWCLFEKDRNVAIAFGRPTMIDLNDCDVPMLTIQDFIEDDPEAGIKLYAAFNETEALFYIHLVKLAEITGIILKHQYSVTLESLKKNSKLLIIRHCDMLMGVWLSNLPPQLSFKLNDPSTQNFYSCLLHAQYYNRLYLIHRANLLRVAKDDPRNVMRYRYPSWGISFTAARMIAAVSKILLDRGQIRFCPSIFAYVIFSALLMLIYYVDCPDKKVADAATESQHITRLALVEFAKNWPIAGTLLRLIDDYADDKSKRAALIQKCADSPEVDQAESEQSEYYPISSSTGGGTDPEYIQQIARPTNSPQSVECSPNQHMQPQSDYSEKFSTPDQQHRQLEMPLQAETPHSYNFQQQQATQNATGEQVSLGRDHEHFETQVISPQARSEQMSLSDNGSDYGNPFTGVNFVTENLPTSKTFYRDFRPMDLFPDTSFPQTNLSTSYAVDHVGQIPMDMQPHPPPPPQPPQNLNGSSLSTGDLPIQPEANYTQPIHSETNFTQPAMNNCFINMNLAPGMNLNHFNEGFDFLNPAQIYGYQAP